MPMRVRPGHCHRRGRWGRSELLVQPDRCHRRMGALRSAGVHATQRCPTVAIDGWARSPTQVLSDCCHRRMGAFHSAGKYAATAARPLPSADGLATACTVRHQRQEHKLSLCTTTTAITYCVLWPAASVDRQDCWPTCASARMAQSRPSAPRGVPPPGPTMIGPRTHESHNIHADTTRPRSHTHFYILDVCAYAFFAQGPGPNPRHGPWRTWSSSVRWGALMQQVLRHRTRVLLPISPILPLVSASGARVLVLEQWVAFGDSLKVGPFFSCGLGAL